MALEVPSIRVVNPSPAPVGAAAGPARSRPAAGRPVPVSGTALPPAPVSKQTLQAVVRHLNEHVRERGGEVEFSISIDKATDRPVVKIINRKTKAVIRQIPPQDILSLDHRLQQLAGLLLRARA
jgi:flagellar protein FlaG